MPGNGAAASYGDLLITSLVVLAGVCIAAYVVVKVVGRFLATGRMRGAHLLDVIARLPLEPRRSLYVVEVAGKTLLVGTSEMGLNVLSELDGNEVKARAVPKQSFGELVRSAWLKRRAPVTESASDPSAETRATRLGADNEDARSTGDASRAHVGAKDARSTADASRAHVGAKDREDARSTADASSAHVGAKDREDARSTADASSAHVGAKDREDARSTADASSAHVGAKDREDARSTADASSAHVGAKDREDA